MRLVRQSKFIPLSISPDEKTKASHMLSHRRPLEWYRGYNCLSRFLEPGHFSTRGTSARLSSQKENSQSQVFPPRSKTRVLILGCGNSSFGEEMLRDGWTGPIVNIDFSTVAIEKMKEKYCGTFYSAAFGSNAQNIPPMEFYCADMTQRLPFKSGSFDLIISKGSFDAVLAGSKASIQHVVAECHRLLAPGHGIFFLVTYGNPDSRIEFLEYKNELTYYWQGFSVHKVLASEGESERSADR